MKTNFIFIIITIIGITSSLSCDRKPDYSKITSQEGWNSFWSTLDLKQKDFIRSKICPISKDTAFNINKILKLGAHIVEADSAQFFTDQYVGQLDVITKKKASKSVYFKIDDLISFLSEIDKSRVFGCTGERGVRFYFAKYPMNYHTIKLQNKTHLVIRLVCDGEDISHFDDANKPQDVAFNYGDVCPPVCKLSPDNTLDCKDGRYNIRPPSPILDCPN